VKAIRGATTARENTSAEIVDATCELLQEIAGRNDLDLACVVSVMFTLTPDLNATFPARAARSIGWEAPMLDMVEVDVPGALPRCIRILVLADRPASAGPVRHVYLRGATQLRPDLEESK
jgi:chorismate mutase